MRQRFIELNGLPRVTELWEAYQNLVQTDLSCGDLLRLAWFGAGLKSSQGHERVFTYDLLTSCITAGGAWVFLVRDPGKVDAWTDEIFEVPPSAATPDRSGSVPKSGAGILRSRDE